MSDGAGAMDHRASGRRGRRATRVLSAALAALALGLPCPRAGAQLEDITNRDATAGLRAALEKGAQAALARLGRKDGFLGDPRVRIPLPDSIARAETLMRRVGLGKHADALVLAMNRSAEEAVAEAKPVFVGAVKQMTVRDAKSILTGGETAGTQYFQRTTSEALRAKFLPIVRRATAGVGLARQYSAYAEHGARFGLVREDQVDLDDYVTRKALDGLFLTVAEEEREIRRDPARAASGVIARVFGALK